MNIEDTMQFILETQAKHEERFTTLVDVCMSLARHGEETDRRIRELSEETNRRFRETDQRFRETDQRMRETDGKLDALIDIVDKMIKRDGRHE